MVVLGTKLKLYPNKGQEVDLRQAFGVNRKLWNLMLNLDKKRYANYLEINDVSVPKPRVLSAFERDDLLKYLKKTEEFSYLKEIDSSALQVTNKQLAIAWTHFFSNPKHFGKPRFKSRKSPKQSYTGKSAAIKILGKHYVQIPKIGIVKVSNTSHIQGKIKRYTISLSPNGNYYLSLNYEKIVKPVAKTGLSIGLDLGIKDLVIASNGEVYSTIRSDYSENQAKIWQRKYSRRYHQAKQLIATDRNKQILIPRELEDFSNLGKARKNKAHWQGKVANERNDFIHKLTSKLVRNYDTIVIEDLKSKNMMRNHHLAKAITNASWYEIRRQLEYKCELYGKKLIVVPAHNTSKLCSNCHRIYEDGLQGKPWSLGIREWTCVYCQTHHHRDINAAKNILERGLKQS